jgi:hypothetical protein
MLSTSRTILQMMFGYPAVAGSLGRGPFHRDSAGGRTARDLQPLRCSGRQQGLPSLRERIHAKNATGPAELWAQFPKTKILPAAIAFIKDQAVLAITEEASDLWLVEFPEK